MSKRKDTLGALQSAVSRDDNEKGSYGGVASPDFFSNVGNEDEAVAEVKAELEAAEEKLERSIVPLDNGTLQYGTITLHSIGIDWGKEPVTLEMFKDLGRHLFRLDGALQWLIGDWLVYGDNHEWGVTIKELAAEFGREISTIYVYKSIAANVKPLIRIKTLSFGHHQLVAPISNAKKQKHWLNKANEGDIVTDKNGDVIYDEETGKPKRKPWSVSRLRYEMKETNSPTLSLIDKHEAKFKSFRRLTLEYVKEMAEEDRETVINHLETLISEIEGID